MGVAQNNDSSLNCELRIIRAKNVELNKPSSKTNLFVRYYLSAGTNKRIKLNSKEISSKSMKGMFWDESFSLECFGSNQDSIQMLMQETVVFELRYRHTRPLLFGGSSHLLGRVEVPWKTILESPNMEIEQWVTMQNVSKNGQVYEGHNHDKRLALQIGMKVKIQARTKIEKIKWDDHDQCGCRDHDVCKCGDANIFAIAALMETF